MAVERCDVRSKVVEQACKDFTRCIPVDAGLLTDLEFNEFVKRILPPSVVIKTIMTPLTQHIKKLVLQ